jgi:hypothetical protein
VARAARGQLLSEKASQFNATARAVAMTFLAAIHRGGRCMTPPARALQALL